MIGIGKQSPRRRSDPPCSLLRLCMERRQCSESWRFLQITGVFYLKGIITRPKIVVKGRMFPGLTHMCFFLRSALTGGKLLIQWGKKPTLPGSRKRSWLLFFVRPAAFSYCIGVRSLRSAESPVRGRRKRPCRQAWAHGFGASYKQRSEPIGRCANHRFVSRPVGNGHISDGHPVRQVSENHCQEYPAQRGGCRRGAQ